MFKFWSSSHATSGPAGNERSFKVGRSFFADQKLNYSRGIFNLRDWMLAAKSRCQTCIHQWDKLGTQKNFLVQWSFATYLRTKFPRWKLPWKSLSGNGKFSRFWKRESGRLFLYFNLSRFYSTLNKFFLIQIKIGSRTWINESFMFYQPVWDVSVLGHCTSCYHHSDQSVHAKQNSCCGAGTSCELQDELEDLLGLLEHRRKFVSEVTSGEHERS